MDFTASYQRLIEFDKKNDVKRKEEIKEKKKNDTPKPKETKRPSRSRSPPQKVESYKQEYINPDIPDRQFGDLYCTVCQSHMNSEQMWENHIKGKRHLKSSRKGDAAEQKYEYCNEEPAILKELEKETKPIAGLDHICEILRINQPPVYQCFLCSASLTTSKLLMDHILGLKHQMAFLKEHDKEKYSLVDSSALSKSYLEPIVEDLMSKYEQEHGRGKMSVKKEKEKKPGSFKYKKGKNDDGDKRIVPKASKRSPPSKSSKRSPPAKSFRYSPHSPSPPPKSSRYSPHSPSSPPPKSSRHSPKKSSRYTPTATSLRYSPTAASLRYSPTAASARGHDRWRFAEIFWKSCYEDRCNRMKEQHSESEWKKVPPARERSRDSLYSERPYSDEEKWPRIEPEPTCYRRAAPTLLDTHDSRLERANNCSRSWPAVDEANNCNDLRAVLEQKKSLGITAKSNMDVPAPVPVSAEITHVNEKLLGLVNDLSPEIFLTLALFKLDNMDVKEGIEKLLDRVANKADALAQKIKQKVRAPDLKAKYKETLVQNGISPQDDSVIEASSQSNLQFTQNMENFIGHYKARKTTVYEDIHPKETSSNHLTPSEQFNDYKSSRHQLNTTSPYRNTSETATTYDSVWNQRPSNSLPFQSFSSTPTNIPGLTLTEELPAQPSAVMSQFAQNAKNIFGNINVPSTPTHPYQNEDYNLLNYRY